MNNRFTTRVELHDYPTAEDYETLHEEMAKRGYIRNIIDMTTGEEYKLPNAEYNLIRNCSVDEALSLAEKAAILTGNRYSILVTQSERRRWVGLELAD